MILIGVAWLLILAIALYQSIHGLFSAVIMALLTTVCAAVALGYYEWLGPAFLYSTQSAYADALSLTLHFVIPLLILRTVFDKLIIGNAPLGGWADRVTGGILGLYIGTVMVGILTIILQMLPYGGSVMGYEPFDSSLQRVDRLYCDELALGVFTSTAGLASDRPFNGIHDDLLLELFCARNTAGQNGRVDAATDALMIPAAFKPGEKWKQVLKSGDLPEDPRRATGKSDVLIIKTSVSKLARSDKEKDGWYRLPATHFRLVTGSGMSLYPLGYITQTKAEAGATDKWQLHPAAAKDGKALVANLCVLRKFSGEGFQEILWVYRLPIPDSGDADFNKDETLSPAEAEQAKLKRAEMYAPNYMVFRRNARMRVPEILVKDLLPELKKPPAPTTTPKPRK